jgi:hypothetical protein
MSFLLAGLLEKSARALGIDVMRLLRRGGRWNSVVAYNAQS